MDNRIAIIITPEAGIHASTEQLAAWRAHASHVVVFAYAGDRAALDAAVAADCEGIAVDDAAGFYAALNRALYPLIDADTDVLFVGPTYRFDAPALDALRASVAADPLYGFALPRTNVGGSAPVPRMPGEPALEHPEAFDRFLAALPERLGGGIVQAAPVLVRADMLYNFGRLEGSTFDLSDALATLFIRANRRGYSAVVCNRAMFFARESGDFTGAVAAPVIERASDFYRALGRLGEFPEQRLQKLLWQAVRPKTVRRVLFDIRNLAPGYNGTAQHILSLMRPICALAAEYHIEPCFWVLPQSADFHALHDMPDCTLVFELGEHDLFDACVRLSQPWSFSELRDQAWRSMVNLYLIMDAIAWDCHYIRMPHIDGVWRTAADHSDGFIYISRYTRRAFEERFPAARDVPSVVSYCSLDPAEYFKEEPGDAPAVAEPYVLVVGNQYYHKGLAEAVRVLAAGFPETRIKVLGETGEQFPNVEQLPSGRLSHEDVDRLFRDCACLVFPSYYEGFGLPVLNALAYGKQVIARDSALIEEIRERVSPVDGIVPFKRRTELLRAVRAVLDDAGALSATRTQARRPREILGWTEAAREVLALAAERIDAASVERSLGRLEFFYRAGQFDVERAGWTNADQNKVIFEVELEE
ncbi:glycosyltransferase [Burkholderia pyrrocinia]|nr:glycosyltransferase [Burkholderia pyrrocinia]EKS9893965.1 glycosyltransferase [Burkholderia pyrrocinia]EKS9910261.1 glycosyltransferase [Burkholderia pyrrocinia]